MATTRQMEKVLNAQVRPGLREHGGDVRLAGWDGAVVLIELLGACAGCPSADLGTKGFIESVLRAAFPEIQGVELERTTPPELLELARQILSRGENR